MDREIKFRGKSLRNDEWLYGDLVHDNIGGSYVYPIDAEGLYKENKVSPNTVGQYTGLKDKNWVEIYEGDILIWGENGHKSQPMTVVFKHGSFGYIYIEDWFHSFAGNTNFTFNPLNTDVRFEIVGNIHDNPELII